MRRKAKGRLNVSIDTKRLEPTDTSWFSSSVIDRPDEAYADRRDGWVVQVWCRATPGCDGTPWDGTLRVAISHTRAKTLEEYDSGRFDVPIHWDELQAIKDHFWPGQIAIEIYPPNQQIVNVANMRWLWVLPQGAILPMNLGCSSPEKMVS